MVNVKTNSTDIGLKANPEDFSKLLKPVQENPCISPLKGIKTLKFDPILSAGKPFSCSLDFLMINT